MLSRTADNLYWTGRYMERAENMARILDVTHRTSLQPQTAQNEWVSVLAILGNQAWFTEKYGEPTQETVTAFLVCDPDNPSSIYTAVRNARENARALRATISTEMWESLNTTWLDLKEVNADVIGERGLREFCDWVKERSHLFRGVTYGTTLHNDALHFLRLGTFLERADNTARLLDSKYHLLGQGRDEASGATNYYEWGAVLRAVSAFRAYHQIYHDVITPHRVAELLLLRGDMPRSLRHCAEHVERLLSLISGGRDLDCERLAMDFHATFRFGRIERIFHGGLHSFLTSAIARAQALSQQISHDFMMTV